MQGRKNRTYHSTAKVIALFIVLCVGLAIGYLAPDAYADRDKLSTLHTPYVYTLTSVSTPSHQMKVSLTTEGLKYSDILFILDVLQWPARAIWTLFALFALIGIIGYITYRPKRAPYPTTNVEFVIVSKASFSVRDALLQTAEHIVQKFGKIPYIVIDEGSELQDGELDHYLKVVVPTTYRPDLLGKGRAIQYFIEHHVESDTWYAFLDDDNLVLDDAFLWEIPYYESHGYVVANPILVPRPGRSKLTYVMDFIRYFDDLLLFRFFTGLLGKPLVGLHGELLLVRGNILQEIGFRHRSLTEDFRFSAEIVRRGYRTWQSATRVSILSPHSIMDLMYQRARWYKGIWMDLPYAPPLMQFIVGIRMLMWTFGVIGSWAFAPLWPLWGSYYLALLGGALYWYVYLYGIYKARAPLYFFLIPILGVIETSTWIFSLRIKDFVVIDKSGTSNEIHIPIPETLPQKRIRMNGSDRTVERTGATWTPVVPDWENPDSTPEKGDPTTEQKQATR